MSIRPSASVLGVVDQQVEIAWREAKGTEQESDLTAMMNRVNGSVLEQRPQRSRPLVAQRTREFDRPGEDLQPSCSLPRSHRVCWILR